MLDGLLGRGGFYSKCKSLIRLTRTRIDVIRRKRNATQKFLKKDIADLLADGLENNAFGRVDGLIAELICTTCYDFIDDACGIVSKHLSKMQQHSDCPEECREAVASLMFAAARFSDLPELRDLRDVFHHQYGDSLEHYVNQKLVEHTSPEPPDVKKKLKLLQDITSEFTVKWNSYALEQRVIGKAAAKEDKPAAGAYLHAAATENYVVAQPKENTNRVHNDAPLAESRAEKVSRWTKAREVLNSNHCGRSSAEAVAPMQNANELFYAREFPIGSLKPPFVLDSSHEADGDIVIPRRELATDAHNTSIGRRKAVPERTCSKGRVESDMPPPYVKVKKSKHKAKHLESDATADDNDTLTFNPGVRNGEPESDIPRYTTEYYKGEASPNDPTPRRRSRRTHHKSSSTPVDEEEEVIDELLLLYSKKASAGGEPSRMNKTGYNNVRESDRDGNSRNKGPVPPPSRSTSLPREHSSSEHKKVFTRAASFDQETSAPAKHVHPKLPDYDDLAARFAALRRNKA